MIASALEELPTDVLRRMTLNGTQITRVTTKPNADPRTSAANPTLILVYVATSPDPLVYFPADDVPAR